ncbi:uncharacterized protein N7484_001867 [Penicillium longicatenatum]|uniref:uncharacterized protein n=1 Tax=Penicillium longicatenatum TaxID=1561947 RepID=UPI00254817B9|nr:uncharacterized protein N7484_001867 [Penicillium longicatenatum]KAJ5658218.1 hypothetical protein N7484_001867 [Penicillium longicatenatum]
MPAHLTEFEITLALLYLHRLVVQLSEKVAARLASACDVEGCPAMPREEDPKPEAEAAAKAAAAFAAAEKQEREDT